MIYIKGFAYLMVIGMMSFFWEQSTKYCSDYHLCFKGMVFATLIHHFINKVAALFFEDPIHFYYLPCIILSALLALYFQWNHFNSKWSKADRIYHGKFSTIQSLINSGTGYEAKYTNFYITKKREGKWDFDKKIQITLSFPDYIRYYIFLVQKQRQDYRKRKAESDLAAANEIKDILTEYVSKNEKEAHKFFQQAEEMVLQIEKINHLDTGIPAPKNEQGSRFVVAELFNPDSSSPDIKYSYFDSITEADLHIKHRIQDCKMDEYFQGNKFPHTHIKDNIYSLLSGARGPAICRWIIIKLKQN